LETFEETLSNVFSPLLKNQTEWGQIKLEKVHFCSLFRLFAD
jgi:hypothetical protein